MNGSIIMSEFEENKPILSEKIGSCGFINIGNTCYIHSIIQLLIHSRLIVNFLLHKSDPNKEFKKSDYAEYRMYLQEASLCQVGEKEKKRLNLSNGETIRVDKAEVRECMENSLVNKLSEIINIIIYKGNCCITPSNFKQIIDMKIPSLRGMGQQDSHELLNGFFDNLIEETGIDSEPEINNISPIINSYINYLEEVKNKIKDDNLTIAEKKIIILNFNEYKKKNYDIINKYCGLKYMIKVFKSRRKSNLDTSSTGYNPLIYNLLTFMVEKYKCNTCSHECCVYQYYTNLVVPVKSTLKECFEAMTEEEEIEKKCELCDSNKSIKKTNIWRPGMTLFIELCRFTSHSNGRTTKNNSFVDIPHEFDISDFCDDMVKTSSDLTYKYKLKGISNHLGNMNGGHYTADCVSIINNKTWYHYDDSSVSQYTDNDIDVSKAYILLYEME